MLDHSGAAFHPIAVIDVEHAVNLAHLGLVDVAADHPVNAAAAGFLGNGGFEILDELQSVFDFHLEKRRQAPVAKPHGPTGMVEPGVSGQQRAIGPIAQEGEPARVLNDPVELIAVCDQVTLAVGRLVDGVARHDHATEVHAAELARALVMIARHIDHLHAVPGHAQYLLHHIVMGLGPVPAGLQFPAIDDIAYEVEGVALQHLDEVEQQLGLTAARTQMHVRYEGGPARHHI